MLKGSLCPIVQSVERSEKIGKLVQTQPKICRSFDGREGIWDRKTLHLTHWFIIFTSSQIIQSSNAFSPFFSHFLLLIFYNLHPTNLLTLLNFAIFCSNLQRQIQTHKTQTNRRTDIWPSPLFSFLVGILYFNYLCPFLVHLIYKHKHTSTLNLIVIYTYTDTWFTGWKCVHLIPFAVPSTDNKLPLGPQIDIWPDFTFNSCISLLQMIYYLWQVTFAISLNSNLTWAY